MTVAAFEDHALPIEIKPIAIANFKRPEAKALMDLVKRLPRSAVARGPSQKPHFDRIKVGRLCGPLARRGYQGLQGGLPARKFRFDNWSDCFAVEPGDLPLDIGCIALAINKHVHRKCAVG